MAGLPAHASLLPDLKPCLDVASGGELQAHPQRPVPALALTPGQGRAGSLNGDVLSTVVRRRTGGLDRDCEGRGGLVVVGRTGGRGGDLAG